MLHGNRRIWAVICMGAVEVALWDIWGKMLDLPVYELLGGAERARHQLTPAMERREVVPYCTVVSEKWDDLAAWAAEEVIAGEMEKVVALRDRGYRAVKIEPLRAARETIVELTRQARAALGPDRSLAVDVGYLWNDVGTALDVAARLAEFDVFFLKTPIPVDALDAYRRLAERTRLRIAAGEHTVTRREFLDLIGRGGLTVAQPYMTTVGGLSEAKRVVDLTGPRGALVCPSNWSTGGLSAATVHLAAYSRSRRSSSSCPRRSTGRRCAGLSGTWRCRSSTARSPCRPRPASASSCPSTSASADRGHGATTMAHTGRPRQRCITDEGRGG